MYRGGKIRPQDPKFRQKEKFRGKIVTNRKDVTCSVGMSSKMQL
jgi:ribosomal protein S30